MWGVTRGYTGTMAIAVLIAGCVSPAPVRQSPSDRHEQPLPLSEPVSSRPVSPSPDVTAVVSYETPAIGASGSGPYRVLKPFDAQCAAAAHCAIANALAYESEIAASQAGCRHASQRSAAVRREAMAYRAAEERNHAAAQALEVFYLLAEAEADRDFLARSKMQIDAVLEEVQDIESRGIRVARAPPNSGLGSWSCRIDKPSCSFPWPRPTAVYGSSWGRISRKRSRSGRRPIGK